MTGQRLQDYLGHILAAAERALHYTAGMDATAFASDELVQDAVIRNIEVIGEASRRIQTGFSDFAAEHPELPVGPAYQMRNAVAHGYLSVDLDVVWATVRTDLPQLTAVVRTLLHEIAS